MFVDPLIDFIPNISLISEIFMALTENVILEIMSFGAKKLSNWSIFHKFTNNSKIFQKEKKKFCNQFTISTQSKMLNPHTIHFIIKFD